MQELNIAVFLKKSLNQIEEVLTMATTVVGLDS